MGGGGVVEGVGGVGWKGEMRAGGEQVGGECGELDEGLEAMCSGREAGCDGRVKDAAHGGDDAPPLPPSRCPPT